jgi:ribosome biogenesis protein
MFFFKRYSIPDNPFSISFNSDVNFLNTLIKSILQDDHNNNNSQSEFDSNIEFDFYINNEIIHQNLAEYFQLNDLNTEALIEIEYIERYPQPIPIDTIITDDWISSIRGNQNENL